MNQAQHPQSGPCRRYEYLLKSLFQIKSQSISEWTKKKTVEKGRLIYCTDKIQSGFTSSFRLMFINFADFFSSLQRSMKWIQCRSVFRLIKSSFLFESLQSTVWSNYGITFIANRKSSLKLLLDIDCKRNDAVREETRVSNNIRNKKKKIAS